MTKTKMLPVWDRERFIHKRSKRREGLALFLILLSISSAWIKRDATLMISTSSSSPASAMTIPTTTTDLPDSQRVWSEDDSPRETRSVLGFHVLQRHHDGSWTPRIDPALRSNNIVIDRIPVLSPHNYTNDNATIHFLGFLRITKTASTALLDFLNHQGAPRGGVVTYDHFLDYPTYFQKVSFGTVRSIRSIVPACVFGYGPQRMRQERTNATGANMLDAYAWQCPHTTYRNIVATWARGLPFLLDQNVGSSMALSSATLQMFTLVREPTERFISFFHYWRQIYPHWKDLATPEEHERMVAGDLEGFLQLQATSSLTINSASQYKYLSTNVTEAISMIRDSPSRVMVLLNECFDVSLRLLADMFPSVIDDHAVQVFLASSDRFWYSSRRNISTPKSSLLEPVQVYDVAELKAKSQQQWLADDYQFYRAATVQFRWLLDDSSLDRDSKQDCFRRLDTATY